MSSPAAPPPMSQEELGVIMGSFLVLICVALILFGVFFAQAYYYWINYEADSRKVRCFVGVVWFIEILHSSLCIQILYFYLINNFLNPVAGLNFIPWSAGVTMLTELCIFTLTEGFYIGRIFKLSGGNYAVVAVPSILLLARFVLTCISAAHLFIYPTWEVYRAAKLPDDLVNVVFSVGLTVDMTITGLMSYYLYKRRTSFARTKRRLQLLMQYSISTGAVAMICSICVIIALNVFKSSLMFAGFIHIISKLYANSALALLNARKMIRKQALELSAINSVHVSSIKGSKETRVNIYRETMVTGDGHEHQTTSSTTQDQTKYLPDKAKIDHGFDA